MSTRAEFLVQQEDGAFLQSALMYDGYPSYVVPYLLTVYKNKKDAQRIANAGDFSSISDPENSKVPKGDKSLRFPIMPRRKAVFAEFCYIFVNKKWHILLEHECLMPLSMPSKV